MLLICKKLLTPHEATCAIPRAICKANIDRSFARGCIKLEVAEDPVTELRDIRLDVVDTVLTEFRDMTLLGRHFLK